MQGKILLIAAKSIFIVGVLLFATGIFLLHQAQSEAGSLKAERTLLDLGLEEKYRLKEAIRPVDFSKLLPEPVKPPESAAAIEKDRYAQELKDYETLKKEDQDRFLAAQKEYEKFIQEQDYLRELKNYHKSKEEYSNFAQKLELESKIKLAEVSAGLIADKYLLQFIGTIILSIGALGILIWGENWERAALLVFLGFAFRTIVGL
jgi:hypothetical protein